MSKKAPSKKLETVIGVNREVDPATVKVLVDRAMAKILDQKVLHDALHEYAADELCDLMEYFEVTACSYIDNADQRQSAAEKEAVFAMALGLGRRIGGAR